MAARPLGRAEHLAILVNSTLYPGIEDSLGQYAADLASEGYTVYVEAVAGGAQGIQDWIQERHAFGCTGVVFIGDIAAAWAEVSGDVFPSDLFYMDLDGHWRDADHDGDYEIMRPESATKTELYVARLYAHARLRRREPDLINDYLAQRSSWMSTLTQPWGGLEYVDKDWFDMEVNLDQIYGAQCRAATTAITRPRPTTSTRWTSASILSRFALPSPAPITSRRPPTESASYAHVYVYSPHDARRPTCC